jgi:hypothetical protein
MEDVESAYRRRCAFRSEFLLLRHGRR